jgi:hypothetical protein
VSRSNDVLDEAFEEEASGARISARSGATPAEDRRHIGVSRDEAGAAVDAFFSGGGVPAAGLDQDVTNEDSMNRQVFFFYRTFMKFKFIF